MNIEQSTAEKEHPPRNLRTHYNETLGAMATLEGPSWLRLQQGGGEQTMASAVEAIQRRTKDEFKDDDEDDHSPIVHVIYGDAGVDRFMVRLDGTVEFSGRHASSPERLAQAKTLGFRIN